MSERPDFSQQPLTWSRMCRSDRIFCMWFVAAVIGIPTLIMWAAVHFDPRVPPCLRSHTESDAGFPLFAVPPGHWTVCDEWIIEKGH